MAERIELKTVLAGPKGVLQPGWYTAERLRAVGYSGLAELVEEVAGSSTGDRSPGVTAVKRIGPKLAEMLAEIHIFTVEDLALVNVEWLRSQLDSANAAKIEALIPAAQAMVSELVEDEEE